MKKSIAYVFFEKICKKLFTLPLILYFIKNPCIHGFPTPLTSSYIIPVPQRGVMLSFINDSLINFDLKRYYVATMDFFDVKYFFLYNTKAI